MKYVYFLLTLGFALALEENIIEHVDEKSGATWKSNGRPFFKSEKEFINRLGVLPQAMHQTNILPIKVPEQFKADALPSSFDARQKWPHCSSIPFIWDQGNCGSCWAVSAATAMSDRLCIHKNHTEQLSATDLLTCCNYCGYGCDGGYPPYAWQFYQKSGLVTGGDGRNCHACECYPFPRRDQNSEDSWSDSMMPTPKCATTCRAEYKTPFLQDKHYGKTAYRVSPNEGYIRNEIMTNGPVQAAFTVYEDFGAYRSGIYFHRYGKQKGGHAVRIIGWGEENGTPYWLVANSWSYVWGERGLFRIKRGNNECGIESMVLGGVPR